jgi:hypothetical protein
MRKDSGAKAVTEDLLARLRRRYSLPEWFYVQEVGLTMSGRRADGLAMNLWKSRGLAVHGFEVKANREGLLRELRDPAKGEAIGGLCDYWWLVLPDRATREGLFLPDTWGVLVKSGRGLRVHRHAEPINGTPGTTLPRHLACALLKRALRVAAEDQWHIRAEIRAEEFERGRDSVTLRDEGLRHDLATMRERLAAFEKASGLRIDSWSGGRELGEAVNLLRQGRLIGLQHSAEQILRRAQELYDGVKGAADALHGEERT